MRGRIAAFLEDGRRRSPTLALLSAVYGRAARPERPLALPAVPVVGVCGATLGGSSVTPVVLALARALDDAGTRVGVAGHGYRAAISGPSRVRPSDDVRAVGDEALWLARALGDRGDVFVAPDRQRALHMAAKHASVVIADGLLQARPERLALSLLVVEGSAPWGAARCPPVGDLRAFKSRLLAAADHVLVIDSFAGAGCPTGSFAGAALRAGCPTGSFAGAALRAGCPTGPPDTPTADATVCALAAELGHDRVHRCISALTGARGPTGERYTLDELRERSVGLVLGIARPWRVLAALSAYGVDPRAVHLYADHHAGDRSQRRFTFSPASPVDLWLATSKCAARLGRRYEDAPVFELSHRVHFPGELTGVVRAVRGPFSANNSVPTSPLDSASHGKVAPMASYRTIARLGLALALTAPLSAAMVACGGPQKGATADIKAGEMPGGGDWTGVYYSPLYGHLHLIREGDAVIGKWRTAAGDKYGEMHGTANGDLYKYEWKETKIGMVGPNATSNGRGYFKYIIPPEANAEHEIKGQWGLGKDETGQVWEAIKQRNQSPDPASVMPDETEQRKEGWEESEEKAPPSEGGGEEGSGGGDDWE